MATTKKLSQVIRFNEDDDKEHGIVSRSKVVLSPGMLPYGFVLRELPGKFVTHMEMYQVELRRMKDEDFG